MSTVISIILVLVGLLIATLQYKVAREKLRQDFFERRFAVFYAFQQLILVVTGLQEESNTRSYIEKAIAARAEASFLFGPEIVPILDRIFKEAFRLRKEPEMLSTPGRYDMENHAREKLEAQSRYAKDRLMFANEVGELEKAFQPYLRADQWLVKRRGSFLGLF